MITRKHYHYTYLHPCHERVEGNADIVIVNEKIANLIVSELKRRYSRNFIIKAGTPKLYVMITCTEKLMPTTRNECAEFALGLIRGISLGKEITIVEIIK